MKKHFYILTFIFFILFPFTSKAQATYQDVVYLKNGSIIHGEITEQIPNQSVKIKTRDENIFVFKVEEIEKITREIDVFKGNAFKNLIPQQKGYLNITELNFALSLAKYDKSGSFGIQTINGYLFNPNFSLGLGVGLDIYNYKAFMPIFIDARYYFFQEKVTPYAAIGAGCALNIDNSYRPDIFINPSIGIRFQLLKKNAFNVGMGYRYQGSLYNPSYFNLKLGVSFW